MRFLICPGMARSGTTFLWRQITKNSALFNISIDQELRYLRTKQPTFEGYLEKFQTTDESKTFFDVSPVYLFKSGQVIENIKTVLKGHQVKFILNIRSPMEHAYSLYLHQIRGHVSRLEQKKSALVSQDLVESGAANQYIFDAPRYFLNRPLRIVEFVEGILENFGRESMTFIDFNREFGTNVPETKLGNLLDVKLNPFDFSEKTNRGGNMLPSYLYGGEDGLQFELGDYTYSIEPRTLVLVGGRGMARSWRDVDPERAATVMNGATLWTNFVPKERAQELFERYYEKQWQRLCELLDYDFLGAVQHKDLVTSKNIPFNYLHTVRGVTVEDAV